MTDDEIIRRIEAEWGSLTPFMHGLFKKALVLKETEMLQHACPVCGKYAVSGVCPGCSAEYHEEAFSYDEEAVDK